MIETIKNFFELIVNALKNGWQFIISVFEDIAYVVKSLSLFLSRITRYLSFIPTPVMAIFGVGITVAVVYKVIGRDG